MKPRTDHYLKPNEGNRIPRRHVFLDVESRREKTGIVEIRTWRMACARFVSAESGRRQQDYSSSFESPEQLWRAVSGFSGRRSRTVVWAHNLGYDARLTDALSGLPALGWSLVAHNLTSRGTWFTWRRGTSTLCFVDSASVFSQPLPQIGKWFGLGPCRMPADDAGFDAWERHCQRNVLILSTAVLRYLDWLEAEDMGNWAMTGSGQAWAAYRHKYMTHKLLVHTDADALAAERRAIWCGRTEAYWHGSLRAETVEEWDIRAAYATIAKDLPIPIRLVGDMPPRYKWERVLEDDRIGLVADCWVTTDTPVVPTRHEGHILWPTGTFHTTLWDNEIQWALVNGASVRIDRGWLYRQAPALHDWSAWILGCLAQPDHVVPAWLKDVLKSWLRFFVGRCAMHYTGWELFGKASTKDIRRWEMIDHATGQESELLQVGQQIWQSTGVQEWGQSLPMITGKVMSATRVAISQITKDAGPYTVLYSDTDSCLVRLRDHEKMAAVAAARPELGLRLKASYDGITIWGPRQLVTGPLVRVAGLPHGSARTGRNTFTGSVHSSMAVGVRDGQVDRVTVTDRDWTVRGVDRRRRATESGWTEAHHLTAAI